MNNSKICQGWVYYIKNKINGKMYIGQTIHFKRRKRQHFNREETCSALKRAFDKYGINNFEMLPIVTFKAINYKVCKAVLNELEKFYIAKYDTYKNGYNSTTGGDGTPNIPRPADVRKRIGEKNKIATSNKKAILQYDLDGNYIKEYRSITEASQCFSNPTTTRNQILIALKAGNTKQSCGFMWVYKDQNSILPHIPPYTNQKRSKVYHYTKNGELLDQYYTISEAAKMTGIPKTTIKTSIRERKRNQRRITKAYWSHEPPKRSES